MEPRPCDPLAAALGNASLLSVGYALLGRWRVAVGSLCLTVVLVLLVVAAPQAAWLRIVVLIWWVAVTVHGWRLARRGRRPGATAAGAARGRGRLVQRAVALAAVALVLVPLIALRADAARIEREAAEAHRTADCKRALSLLDELGLGHEVADPRLVRRAETSAEACELLREAQRQYERTPLTAASTLEEYEAHPGALWDGAPGQRADLVLAEAAEDLDKALWGDEDDLATAFDHLAAVLAEFPRRESDVEAVLDAFLDALPTDDPCDTKTLTDWLAERPASGDVLDRAADVVPRVAPAAIVGCGDQAMAREAWETAQDRYQELLDEYPEHDLASEARAGIERAQSAIELDRLRDLLLPPSRGEQPPYCDNPEPYRGADPYRSGGSLQAAHFGHMEHKRHLPDAWLTTDPAEVDLVICVGELEYGDAVETCTYESPILPFGQEVTFHNREFPIRVYEVRTGELVRDGSIQIGGASCPNVLRYEYYGVDTGPPPDEYVDPSPADVRAAYEPLFRP